MPSESPIPPNVRMAGASFTDPGRCDAAEQNAIHEPVDHVASTLSVKRDAILSTVGRIKRKHCGTFPTF
jgi:hypothetical protein